LTLTGILSSGVLANELIHVVARGETIFSLSRAYGVTVEELMRVNNITDPSTLQAGRRLVIPGSGSPPSPVSEPVISQNLRDYRAVRGDTLFSIARTHGITLQRLLEINRFAPNHTLRAGDVIKVPAVATAQGAATQGATTQGAVTQGTTTQGTAVRQPSTQNAGTNNGTANNRPASSTTPITVPSAATGIYGLRWPVIPKDITYMTGQMGVVVEGERFESVKSLTQGNVVSAGPWRKYGRVVIVEAAGGYYYMYGGLESLSVSVGTRIRPGMEVGKLGINTVSDKPQLFFMVFRNDTPIDPASAPRAEVPRVGLAGTGSDSSN
jgi:murein DD-endopeptidase MepM/ murein hydrolase activator NlpD